MRGAIKTAAAPSGPALIAGDSQGLGTELFTEHSTVTRSGLSGSKEKHVLCVVCIWHSRQCERHGAPNNSPQSNGGQFKKIMNSREKRSQNPNHKS